MVMVPSGEVELLSLPLDGAEVAAAAFLARYSGRTLEAHWLDLRGWFAWAATHRVGVGGHPSTLGDGSFGGFVASRLLGDGAITALERHLSPASVDLARQCQRPRHQTMFLAM